MLDAPTEDPSLVPLTYMVEYIQSPVAPGSGVLILSSGLYGVSACIAVYELTQVHTHTQKI